MTALAPIASNQRVHRLCIAVVVALVGCGEPTPERVSALSEAPSGLTVEAPFPFVQASFYLTSASADLRVRVRRDGAWRAWRPAETTWSEAPLHVARLVLETEAGALQLRTDGRAEVMFHGQVDAVPARVRGLATRESAIAPEELVISRHQWGARVPDQICGEVVSPYRMSIHHTAAPSDDGGDAAARLRQMQAFHMDNRGWCDIGYHFVVSQAGQIYQGRSDERRPGAHVGGQNSGNVGVSLIGNFEEQVPGDPQLDAAARIVGWVSRTYDIPLRRDVVKGHREWPGQQTACPGANLLPRLEDILERAGDREVEPPVDAAPPPPPPDMGAPPVGTWAASFDGSDFPGGLNVRMTPGAEAAGGLRFRNVGDVAWDPARLVLATARPTDHDSALRAADWLAPSRPAAPDVVTPAGAVARFPFRVRAPDAPGEYVERFTVLVDDAPRFDGLEVTLTVRVLADPDAPDAFAEPTGADGGVGGGGGSVVGTDGGPDLAGTPPAHSDTEGDGGGCDCDVARGGSGPGWWLLLLVGVRRRRL